MAYKYKWIQSTINNNYVLLKQTVVNNDTSVLLLEEKELVEITQHYDKTTWVAKTLDSGVKLGVGYNLLCKDSYSCPQKDLVDVLEMLRERIKSNG